MRAGDGSDSGTSGRHGMTIEPRRRTDINSSLPAAAAAAAAADELVTLAILNSAMSTNTHNITHIHRLIYLSVYTTTTLHASKSLLSRTT